MIEFFLFVIAFILGYGIKGIRAQAQEVKIKILVDSKQAILDLNQAEEAIKKLKREMNL
jgi:cbb3-type cytochrome oxidase subunit 3